jgi:hypothetical protein
MSILMQVPYCARSGVRSRVSSKFEFVRRGCRCTASPRGSMSSGRAPSRPAYSGLGTPSIDVGASASLSSSMRAEGRGRSAGAAYATPHAEEIAHLRARVAHR